MDRLEAYEPYGDYQADPDRQPDTAAGPYPYLAAHLSAVDRSVGLGSHAKAAGTHVPDCPPAADPLVPSEDADSS